MVKKDGSIMVILSSPSGAGKTTISKKLQQKYQNFKVIIANDSPEFPISKIFFLYTS